MPPQAPLARRFNTVSWLWICPLVTTLSCVTYLECTPEDPVADGDLPARLSQTGLYADIATRTLASDVRPFQPAFPLWTDGAKKSRWILLPPGAQIDTTNPDDWLFPVGTKVWKEFAVDGIVVETRLLERVGPLDSDWVGVAYVWTDDDAIARPEGVFDARGTNHNVPTAGECMGCHGGRTSRVLGFAAVQLGGASGEGGQLAELVSQGRLSHPLPSERALPGTAREQQALGYLHANCSHCHNQQRPTATQEHCFDPLNNLDFLLPVEPPAKADDLPTYRSAVGSYIVPGDPDGSELLDLVSTRGAFGQMPPLGTEQVDDEGVRVLRTWIGGME